MSVCQAEHSLPPFPVQAHSLTAHEANPGDKSAPQPGPQQCLLAVVEAFSTPYRRRSAHATNSSGPGYRLLCHAGAEAPVGKPIGSPETTTDPAQGSLQNGLAGCGWGSV